MLRVWALTRDALEENLKALIHVSSDVSPWREEHFRFNLPEKWRLSFYVTDGKPVGYAILSLRGPAWIHLHQFMVASAARGGGIGAQMLQEVKARCIAEDARLTLKVAAADTRAQHFYHREGLRADRRDGDYLWMSWTAERSEP